jgi:hypothetical protein
MFEIILGAIIAIVIAYIFYRRSTQDLEKAVAELRIELANLKDATGEIQQAAKDILADSDMIRKHVTYNTTDDPKYPYK